MVKDVEVFSFSVGTHYLDRLLHLCETVKLDFFASQHFFFFQKKIDFPEKVLFGYEQDILQLNLGTVRCINWRRKISGCF